MIARLRVLLPFRIIVAPHEQPEPIHIETQGLAATAYPPYRCAIPDEWLAPDATVAVTDIPRHLYPADPQPISEVHRLADVPCVLANTLQLDFHGDFARTSESLDTLVGDGFAVINELLLRLRALVRAQPVRTLAPTATFYQVELLNDDGTELEPDPELLRMVGGGRWVAQGLGISRELWQAIEATEDGTRLPSWHALLLDASELLPHVGPALVLAAAAIETRVESALDQLAGPVVSPALWQWINDRGDYRKAPSVAERLTVLLDPLGGKSLKRDEPELWEGYRNLRDARNSFVHDGAARIGNREVDELLATELVKKAYLIVEWLTELAGEPADPPFKAEEMGFQFLRLLARGQELPSRG